MDLEGLAAISASPLPYDLFRDIHKGLRRAMFRLIEQAGHADFADTDQRRAVVERAERLVTLLNSHHANEDRLIAPRLRRHSPVIAAMIDESHVEIDATIIDLGHRVAELADLSGADAVVKGCELYLFAAGFAAIYLAHLSFEEGAVMAALREAMSIGDLYALDRAVRAAIEPIELCDFMADLAPAMNVEECATLLGGLKRAAAPEVFERFRAATENALSCADYLELAARLALV